MTSNRISSLAPSEGIQIFSKQTDSFTDLLVEFIVKPKDKTNA